MSIQIQKNFAVSLEIPKFRGGDENNELFPQGPIKLSGISWLILSY